jgi:Protein of unknown function (DUF2919)
VQLIDGTVLNEFDGTPLMSRKYTFEDYDKNLSLKVSTELWLVVLYFLHPYILLISARRSTDSAAAGLKNIVFPNDFSLAIAILATLPALCFIYAWTRRSPGASSLVKYIWRNGSLFLTSSGLFNIATVLAPLFVGVGHKMRTVGWVQLGISVVIIAYVQFSRRVKDTFADFPEDQGTKQS